MAGQIYRSHVKPADLIPLMLEIRKGAEMALLLVVRVVKAVKTKLAPQLFQTQNISIEYGSDNNSIHNKRKVLCKSLAGQNYRSHLKTHKLQG